jgi:hypothetical protein
MSGTHERMANDMGLIAEDESHIAYSISHERGATGLYLWPERESRDVREEREKLDVMRTGSTFSRPTRSPCRFRRIVGDKPVDDYVFRLSKSVR